jgi:DNA-binding MarR family transcriptional regulator
VGRVTGRDQLFPMNTSDPLGFTASEQDAWRTLAAVLFTLPTALDTALQREARLTHFEYVVLETLAEAPNRTRRMSDLAALTSGSLSRLSHVVKRLERRGWIRRAQCQEDGRYTNAILTDEGNDKAVASVGAHVRVVRALVIDALSPTQLDSLREIGEAIRGRVAAEAL